MDEMFLLKSSRHPKGFMNEADSVLDGFTIREVIEALHNEPGTLTTQKLHGVVQDILDSKLQDLWAIIDENDEEIIAAAYKGRSDDPHKALSFDMDWADRA